MPIRSPLRRVPSAVKLVLADVVIASSAEKDTAASRARTRGAGFSARRLGAAADDPPLGRTHSDGMSASALDLTCELRPPLARDEAMIEADRCLECGVRHAQAPCVAACPAGVDVPSFVAAIAAGDPDAAASIIFRENLLGASCARVCPVEVLCEGACVLEHDGRKPIAIGALQRYAADTALARGNALRWRQPSTGHRVAVIGAGPAGLACAGELAARGNDVTVYDERDEVGGLVRYAIAPYRIQADPLPAEARALEELGVRFRLGTRIDGPDALRRVADGADAVFLGVGMGADADVSYPGDDLDGVWESLLFIEALKTGRPPDVGRRVVVIGGGNTAVDVAREAIRLGAEDVTMIYRRTRREMPAYAYEVAEAEEEGVRFRWLANPVRFLGSQRLEGVECVRMALGDPDDGERRRPVLLPGSEVVVAADTAVKAIGQRPRSELAEWIRGLELERGVVAADPLTGRTGNPKFFAGGDVVNGGTSAVQAVQEGKRAARAIDEWLRCGS
ncbi:MAG: NAD(P)-dependent oxidoreductase [Gaiellaceae bacterium]